MSKTRKSWLVTLGLVCAVSSACAPRAQRRSQAPTPNRTTDSLAAEIRHRHDDVIQAIRLGDTVRLQRNLAANAVLVTPGRDTIRGIPAITRAMHGLRAAKAIETIRNTAASDMIRCYDGVLERTGEWTLTTIAADSSRQFLRGPLAIRWVTREDSLAASVIDMVAPSLSTEGTGCESVDQARFTGRRLEVFFTAGVYSPASYYKSAQEMFTNAGYGPANSGQPLLWPNGAPPTSQQLLGISGRVTDRFWLTFAAPRQPENANLGRCDYDTYNYVQVARNHWPAALMVDLRLPHGFSVGAGPAMAKNKYFYQEVDFNTPPAVGSGQVSAQQNRSCGLSVKQRRDSSSATSSATGIAAAVQYQLPMGPRAAMIARLQTFRFSSAEAPTTSRGMSLSFRDLGMTLGFGMAFIY